MQNIFKEVSSLDARCYKELSLSEDILMEHAADGMADFIRENFSNEKSITIICGKSNNGADGLALARLLFKEYTLHVMLVDGSKSEMAQLQLKRLNAMGFTCSNEFKNADIIVDALYGTGFKGEFSDSTCKLFKDVNALHALKIACDIPSGLRSCGTVAKECFKADFTLTMGALKLSMFSDEAKDVIGDVKVLNLGIARELFETNSSYKLLEKSDLKLPFRETQNTHKGSFGHLCVVSGEKLGASVISSQAALSFGVGLCTMLMKSEKNIPYEIMSSNSLHVNTTAIALGMGLGEAFNDSELEEIIASHIPKICDADIFYKDIIFKILKQENIVLTPHPKEFVALLKKINLCDISVAELQKNRFKYVELFSKHYSHITLLLKGANVIITCRGKIYVNPYGTSALAKGGSGDVLSGMIGALLAQGYTPIDATCSASLAHAIASNSIKKNSYALLPQDIIKQLSLIHFPIK